MNTPMVFTFGSNAAGIHGAGAAKVAYQQHGARMRHSYGYSRDQRSGGHSFAIPTKSQHMETLKVSHIGWYVHGFIAFATGHPEMTFQVTRIGCGLAGLPDEAMAMLFMSAPQNCYFDELWHPYLGDFFSYWGTF